MTTKILTFRVPAPVYSELCASAAELGVPISAYLRRLIEDVHQADQINQLRIEVLARLESLMLLHQPSSQVQSREVEEILLLSRATAAHLNPQLVAQVRAKLPNQK